MHIRSVDQLISIAPLAATVLTAHACDDSMGEVSALSSGVEYGTDMTSCTRARTADERTLCASIMLSSCLRYR